MENLTENIFSNFSKHLFWDIDRSKLDVDIHRKYIINRVMQYGLIGDWNEIVKIYGVKIIAETATSIRDLDKKSVAFLSLLSGIPKEKFLCTTTQSNQILWNF